MERSPNMKTVTVTLPGRDYDILIGRGLIRDAGSLIRDAAHPTLAVVITDENIADLYLEAVRSSIESTGLRCVTASIPAGESSKSLEMARRLYDDLAEAGADRGSVVVALGGGVVGDLAGFVAATYMRGIPYVQLPTTLLADVDSSVGGKVAVNHARGKNLIGAFYQPRLVIADIDTLDTLPTPEFCAGMVEVIKYGIIRDLSFLGFLEQRRQTLRDLAKDDLEHVVQRCCQIKADVVQEDETETGVRAILNFGHTIGHALETLAEYADYRHGEAVAVGTIAACMLSERLVGLSRPDTERVTELLAFFDAPSVVRGLDASTVLETMRLDKKAVRGRIRFVLTRSLGSVEIRDDVDDRVVLDVLREIGCD